MKNVFLVALVVLAFTACNGSKQSASSQGSNSTGTYAVDMETTQGPVVITVDRSLAPNGAQHFYDLVKAKYFDGARFYRVVPGFVVQWGGAADPAVSKKWDVTIPDDPVKTSNVRGTVTFAATGQPNTRTTHLFINLADNGRLDGMGFAPIGRVTSGMDAVDKIYPGYGEQPDQSQIASSGNAYLEKQFPKLDYIKTARIVSESQ
jgi:peptidyl-prolyl cis-trans isomerase A (cyclophilin A)